MHHASSPANAPFRGAPWLGCTIAASRAVYRPTVPTEDVHEPKRYPEIPGGRHSVRRHGGRARPRQRPSPRRKPFTPAAARLRQRCARAAHRHGDHEIHHDNHHNAFISNLNANGRQVAGPGDEADRRHPVQPLGRAGGRAHAGAQQPRRSLEPHLLLGADDAGRRQGTGRRPEERHRRRVRRRRQDEGRRQGGRPRRASARAGPGSWSTRTRSSRSSARANQDTPQMDKAPRR